MNTLTIANQKGGVGKSALSCQYAYYLAIKLNLRVLVMDLDHQGNSTTTLTAGKIASISDTTSSAFFTDKITTLENTNFLVLPADAATLRTLEQKADQHNDFATNLKRSLKAVSMMFDVCIIDVNPNPDIRQLAALVVSDCILSPVQLAQESVDGIGTMINDPTIGIRRVQSTINPSLKLLGILPNIVEATNYQKTNFADMAMNYGSLLIPLNDGFAAIKKSTGVFEAQATGSPIFASKKSSSKAAWKDIEPVFEKLASMMDLQTVTEPKTQAAEA